MSLQTYAGLHIDASYLNLLPYTGGADYLRLDERSFGILLRIQERLSSLRPAGGIPTCRELWFEVVTDGGKVAWWFVRSHVWEDMRALIIGNGLTFHTDLGLKEAEEDSNDRWDLAPCLTAHAEHIDRLVTASDWGFMIQ